MAEMDATTNKDAEEWIDVSTLKDGGLMKKILEAAPADATSPEQGSEVRGETPKLSARAITQFIGVPAGLSCLPRTPLMMAHS